MPGDRDGWVNPTWSKAKRATGDRRLRRRPRAARPSLRVGRTRAPVTVLLDGWSPGRVSARTGSGLQAGSSPRRCLSQYGTMHRPQASSHLDQHRCEPVGAAKEDFECHHPRARVGDRRVPAAAFGGFGASSSFYPRCPRAARRVHQRGEPRPVPAHQPGPGLRTTTPAHGSPTGASWTETTPRTSCTTPWVPARGLLRGRRVGTPAHARLAFAARVGHTYDHVGNAVPGRGEGPPV